MDLSRKRSLREAYDAFSVESIRKLEFFITQPTPPSVSGLPIHCIINIDETGFYLNVTTLKYGRGYTTCRTCYPAYCKRNEPKVNTIMGIKAGNGLLPQNIDGSVEQPQR